MIYRFFFFILVTLISIDSYAQSINLETKFRRRYDQIHIEIWISSNYNYKSNIGNGRISFSFDTLYLQPINNFELNTDSISENIDQINPIVDIFSPLFYFSNFDIPMLNINNNQISFEFNKKSNNNIGFAINNNYPGTYLATLKFKIKNTVNENSITNIKFIESESNIYDINNNSLLDIIAFKSFTDYKILGVDILSPKENNTVLNRDKKYLSLTASYTDKGYPIYYERTINPAKFTIPNSQNPRIDKNLAYLIELQDTIGNLIELGRFTENDIPSYDILNNPLYYSGAIANPATNSSYITTSYKGNQLNIYNFRMPIRVLFKKETSYNSRYDKVYMQFTQLADTFGIPLLARPKDNIISNRVGALSIGKIFFLSLNGSDEFLKTEENISNATQLTVEAWVNLRTIKGGNSEPAIIASSAGEDANPVNGSIEGSWMLYLKDGKYPAFRVREIENRGSNGYLANLKAFDPIDAIEINEQYTNDFDRNWNYIAATVNNNIVKLFVNGELVDQFQNDSALDIRMLITNHPIWIGVNPNNKIEANNHLPAAIKALRLWKIPLTQDEIRKYAAGLPNPTNVNLFDDIRRGLIFYYKFSGDLNDYANEINYQHNEQKLNFFKAKTISQSKPLFKTDFPHIKITSPATNSALSNLENNIYDIRWLSYGIGDFAKSNSKDIDLEYSLNGLQWFSIRDSMNRTQSINNALDAEKTISNWEPYNNNDQEANLRTINPFVKKVLLKASGTIANKQKESYFITDTITIAPYFSLHNPQNTIIATDKSNTINFENNPNLIELWIKPYKISRADAAMPIITKIDTNTKKEYFSIKLLPTGQIEFNILDNNDTLRTAKSDINKPIIEPNSIAIDTFWTHIAIYFDNKNNDSLSFIRFYIDGNPQNNKTLTNQLGKSFTIPNSKNIPTYFISYPSTDNTKQSSFDGEIREFHFWNNAPDTVNTDSIYDNLTIFIQGAIASRSKNLIPEVKKHLKYAISFNGGTGTYLNRIRIIKSEDYPDFYLNYYNNSPKYIPVEPYIKLVEPQYRQRVNNRDTNFRIRWVGFDYADYFRFGTNNIPPFLEYSIFGGGGNQLQPYKFVGSLYWKGNTINSISIPDNKLFIFNKNIYPVSYAAILNIAKANPDKNDDGIYTDQSALSPTLTNARLKLNAKYKIFDTEMPIYSEGTLFTISPASNITIRAILQGYFVRKDTLLRNIGYSYDSGGIRIKIYEDNNGKIGKYINTAESFFKYTDINPQNLNNGNNQFANIDYFIDSLDKKSYWILLQNRNHLPVLTRFAAPLRYEGDDPDTWKIESGWDFISWNGQDQNYLPDTNYNPWANRYFTAWGNAIADTNDILHKSNSLIYSSGLYANPNDGLSMMIAGDVNNDNTINKNDFNLIRNAEATINYKYDITGDTYINADDRILAEQNFGKYSLINTEAIPSQTIPQYTPETRNIEKIENDILLSSDASARVQCDFEVINGILNCKIYLRANNTPFYLGSSTIAFEFDTNNLKYNSFITNADMPFQLARNGYSYLKSAPSTSAPLALKNVRTIEINFDKSLNKKGAILDTIKTYIATLKFNILSNKSISIKWHPSTTINTTQNKLENQDIILDSIPFILKYKSKLLYPNGGEEFRPKTMININWTATGIGSINLQYSSDNGKTWNNINSKPIDVRTLKHTWQAPKSYSDYYLIRITDAELGIEIDRSDSTFSIVSGFAYFIKPSYIDEIYIGGTKSFIKWASGGLSDISLLFSADSGKKWTIITNKANALLKEYMWVVPKITTSKAKIRMVDNLTKDTIIDSDLFKIMANKFTFYRPDSTHHVPINRPYNVIYIATGLDSFDLYISYDNGSEWSILATNLKSNTSMYLWKNPNILTNSARIRAVRRGDDSFEYARTDMFKIYDAGTIISIPEGINIAPNPAKDVLYIKNKSNLLIKSYSIIDIIGKVIETKKIKDNLININNLQTGTYILMLNIGNHSYYIKFIKI